MGYYGIGLVVFTPRGGDLREDWGGTVPPKLEVGGGRSCLYPPQISGNIS